MSAGPSSNFENLENDPPPNEAPEQSPQSPPDDVAPAEQNAQPAPGQKDYISKDIFLLYNEREPDIPQIANQLRALGFTVHYWSTDVPHGEFWREYEMDQLRRCGCVCIFLGEKGWGDTHAWFAEQALSLKNNLITVVLSPSIPSAPSQNLNDLFKTRRYFELIPVNDETISLLGEILRNAINPLVDTTNQASTTTIFREASSTKPVLNADQYATVIANLIETISDGKADEALSMALLAPWGRGKTYLVKLISKRLAKKSFDTIVFSAWKYRTSAELWSYLYEVMYDTAVKSGFSVRIRTGLQKHRFWPIFFILLFLGLSLATLSQKIAGVWYLIGIVGIGSIGYLAALLSGTTKATNAFIKNYWNLPRHQERLGLQHAIGDDLRNLLLGWIPDPITGIDVLKVTLKQFVASALAAIVAFTFCYLILLYAIDEKSSTDAWIFFAFVIVIAIFSFIAVPIHAIFKDRGSKRRILLVVDDLDRCEPAQMLATIECLQLFLDDPEVNRRLKIIMLVEEQVLRRAIIAKHENLIPKDADKRTQEGLANELVGDVFEKMFLLWIRLEKLAADEVKEVFQGVCESLVVQPETTSRIPEKVSVSPSERLPTTSNPDTVSGNREPIGEPKLGAKDVISGLTQEEATTIQDSVRLIMMHTKRAAWTPRAIRSFVFRYQLVRMLLAERGLTFSTHEIIKALATCMSQPPSTSQDAANQILMRIARQVA